MLLDACALRDEYLHFLIGHEDFPILYMSIKRQISRLPNYVLRLLRPLRLPPTPFPMHGLAGDKANAPYNVTNIHRA